MRVAAFPLFLATFWMPLAAFAQGEVSAEVKAAARDLAQQGVQLADSGDCTLAIEKLRRAETLFHAPTILGRLGECLVNTGKLVEGSEELQRVAREELGPKPPAPFVAAQERARKILETTLPRIARIQIQSHGPLPASLRVVIDAVRVPDAMIGVYRPTDPGSHTLIASAPGFKQLVVNITLAEGETQDVELRLERESAVSPPVASTKPPAASDTPPASMLFDQPPVQTTPEASNTSTMRYVSLGAAVLGVGLGSTFGLMALSKKGSLDNACQGKICPADRQGDIDQMNRFATVSTVGFAVGMVGLGGFVYYSLASPSNHSAANSSSAPKPSMGVALGPTGVAISGGF
jgi:hypothetical protein